MESNILEKKINILMENEDGKLCLVEVDDYNELVNDYNDAYAAKVFFASCDGQPINPYAYHDFLSLTKHIRNEIMCQKQK